MDVMHAWVVAGYGLSAIVFARAWWNPRFGERSGIAGWVSFTGLCLAEFLSLHATTLLGGFALAARMDPDEWANLPFFGLLLVIYAVFAIGAYSFHRSHRALFAFYLLLVIRSIDFVTVETADADVMRADVLKNFMMTVPLMILVGVISMSREGESWPERARQSATIVQRAWNGRELLAAAAYYALWAYVEFKWPERITYDG